jgi:hypothetical protein
MVAGGAVNSYDDKPEIINTHIDDAEFAASTICLVDVKTSERESHAV